MIVKELRDTIRNSIFKQAEEVNAMQATRPIMEGYHKSAGSMRSHTYMEKLNAFHKPNGKS